MPRRTHVGMLLDPRKISVDSPDIPTSSPPLIPEWHPSSFMCDGYPHRGCYSTELGIYVLAAKVFDSFGCVLFWSEDGISWTGGTLAGSSPFDVDHTNPFTHSPNYGNAFDVAWSPSLEIFVAVGGNQAPGTDNIYSIATSTDGKNWTRRGNPFAVGAPYPDAKSVTWSESQAIFVVGANYSQVSTYPGPSNNIIATSPDGITWTTHSSPWNSLASTSSFAVRGLAYSPSLNLWVTIAVGNYPNAIICTSSDGITWTEQDTPLDGEVANYESDVDWSVEHGIFIAASDAAGIITSPDGIEWTERTNPFDPDPYGGYGVLAIDEKIYIAGKTADSTHTLIKSTNGTTWTTEPSPVDDPLGGGNATAWGIFADSVGPYILGTDVDNNPLVAGYY
jgi:hypothetical protein